MTWTRLRIAEDHLAAADSGSAGVRVGEASRSELLSAWLGSQSCGAKEEAVARLGHRPIEAPQEHRLERTNFGSAKRLRRAKQTGFYALR